MIEQLDTAGRWWRVGQHEVDLSAQAGSYPPHVRAAALATRDGQDDHAADVAALAEAIIDGSIPPDPAAERMITQWMFDQSQRIVARARNRATIQRETTHEHAA